MQNYYGIQKQERVYGMFKKNTHNTKNTYTKYIFKKNIQKKYSKKIFKKNIQKKYIIVYVYVK